MKNQTIIINKKAKFNYYLEKKYEAGIILEGWEVKSIKNKKIQITNSYIKIKKNKIYIMELIISPIISSCTNNTINTKRDKELLLKIKKIIQINSYINKGGYSIIPLEVYLKEHLIKIEIAVSKGKKIYNKKKDIKEKEINKKEF